MSPAEREQVHRLCERIQNESDPTMFTKLVLELNEYLKLREDRAAQRRQFSPQAMQSTREPNPYFQLRERGWLHDLLAAMVTTTRADFGTLQLYDLRHGVLRIVAHRGFERDFLEHFETVDCSAHCACGAAMKQRSRIVVGDVATDPVFNGGSREMLLHSMVRSVQSTPLVDATGRFMGMVSTHYRDVGGPQADMWPKANEIAASFMARAQDY